VKKRIQIVKSDGTTNVLELTNVDGGWAVNFGEGADQKVVLGDALASFLTDFFDDYKDHTHILATGDVKVTGTAAAQNNPNPITVPSVSHGARISHTSTHDRQNPTWNGNG
jgi:hypothetical protein